jgi:hypothetical protein
MIRFYLNRELSAMFGFKLSRWKRWSREFLPPDPLGGLQSGFARQYSLPEAFQVYLGGHLVADLKISIPETKIKEYRIYIFMNLEPNQDVRKHAYMVRRVIDQEKSHGKGARIVTERYIENWLKDGATVTGFDGSDGVPYWMATRILYITKVHQIFTEKLQGESI